jgi:DNA-binding GntR family transcriptional regulator
VRRATRKPLSEHAYEQIRDAIVAGELAPGERLRDAELADRLGTSRTPIREALRRLDDEGLVVTEPNSSTRVAPLDADVATEAFPVLAALHALATRLGVPALTPALDDRMERTNERRREALARGDTRAAIALDDDFHGVLVAAARNRELARTIERLLPKIHRLDVHPLDALSEAEVHDDHGPILEACRARDAALASRLVEESFLRLGDSAAAVLLAEHGR